MNYIFRYFIQWFFLGKRLLANYSLFIFPNLLGSLVYFDAGVPFF